MPFAPKARFVHGSPFMVDYTPGSAVAAGDVVVLGAQVHVAHSDIAANALGAVSSPNGCAVYDFVKKAADVVADRAKVYWDNTNKYATVTSTSNTLIGLALGAAAGADATVRVIPIAPAASI